MFVTIPLAIFLVIMMIYFSLRQLFLGPRRDKSSSMAAPARALTGNLPLPVFGHTRHFRRHGGDIIRLFRPYWTEWKFLPRFLSSKQLHDCFAIFIWGQWRIVVHGPERTRAVLNTKNLQPGWAFSTPKSLLGKTSLPMLRQGSGSGNSGEDDVALMKNLLKRPLDPTRILRFSKHFALAAETTIDHLFACHGSAQPPPSSSSSPEDEISSTGGSSHHMSALSGSRHGLSGGDDTRIGYKLDFRALRSYTLDFVNGPMLGLNLWDDKNNKNRNQASSSPSKGQDFVENITEDDDEDQEDEEPPSKEMMLLWMERIKHGLLSLMITVGGEWMQVWRLNNYGRAVNARKYIFKVLARHVANKSKDAPIERIEGVAIVDAFAKPFPYIALAENLYLDYNYPITDKKTLITKRGHYRSRSLPSGQNDSTEENPFFSFQDDESGDSQSNDNRSFYLDTEQDLALSSMMPTSIRNEQSKDTATTVMVPLPSLSDTQSNITEQRGDENRTTPSKKLGSVSFSSYLDDLLLQKDTNGKGMTQVVMSELCFLTWMALDIGNSWTAMALHILAVDRSSCLRIQRELESLCTKYHPQNDDDDDDDDDYPYSFLCKRDILLSQMPLLDALIYESIRLCPPFCGGLMKTNETVETDAGIQIPAKSNIFFSCPTVGNFSLDNAHGKNPMDLGSTYPCPEILGFLPLGGMEVPLMVLQTKMFLIVFLRRCNPSVVMNQPSVFRRVMDSLQGSIHSTTNSMTRRSSMRTSVQWKMDGRKKSISRMGSLEDCQASAAAAAEEGISGRGGFGSDGSSLDDEPSISDPNFCGINDHEDHDDEQKNEDETETARRSPFLGQDSFQEIDVSQVDCYQWFTKIPFPEPRKTITFLPREEKPTIEATGPAG